MFLMHFQAIFAFGYNFRYCYFNITHSQFMSIPDFGLSNGVLSDQGDRSRHPDGVAGPSSCNGTVSECESGLVGLRWVS